VEQKPAKDRSEANRLERTKHAMGGGGRPIWSLMLPFRRIQL
jgi:hypothetical protein